VDETARTPPADFRMPAEWAPHEATWLSWPHNVETWPHGLAAAEAAMVEAARAIAGAEHVHVNVLDADHERHVRRLLERAVASDALTLHRIPTNDAWVRDHGAIVSLSSDGSARMALDFDYNAWGGKYPPFDLDQRVAARMAAELGIDVVKPGIVLEGGSIDVNGAGALLTTEQCLLNPNRNPTLEREAIEAVLRWTLGIRQIVWLGEGIEGDDTDGHVDDITRFVAPATVVTAVERNEHDPNFAPLAANRRMLETLDIEGFGRLEVLELPMPEPVYDRGQRLPASYANFYVANGVVLLPVFGCEADDRAAGVLRGCFPGRRVVMIEARALVQGLGAIHCLTQQIPAARRLL
jgi:agmatine deiminase